MRPSQSIPVAQRITAVLLCVIWLCQTGVYPAVLAMLEGFEQNHAVNVQWSNGEATVTLHHSTDRVCHQHDLMERLVMLWAADSQERDHVVKTSGVNQDVKSGLRLMAREDALVAEAFFGADDSAVPCLPLSAAKVRTSADAWHWRDAVKLRSVQLMI